MNNIGLHYIHNIITHTLKHIHPLPSGVTFF